MGRQKNTVSGARRRHSDEFKAEALALADRVGVHEAAEQLKLQSSQLYSWRTQANNRRSKGAAESELAAENARLKRQLAEKEQELTIVKNSPPAPPPPVARETVSPLHSVPYPRSEAARFLVARPR
ncbi:MAG: transposase [Gammaproteobacteria bacterium]|nr:transposase [Gammaproteobacteria bacterium]